jgi:hypothetical protein
MSDMQSPIYLVIWVTAACAALLIWSLGIKRLILDKFRQRVFELRFELFTLGMNGELSYDDPAYRSYEVLLCGLLRYAHRISALTYFVSVIERNRAKKSKDYVDVSQQIHLRVSRLSPPLQDKLNEIAKKANTVITLYMVFSSLPFAALIISFVIARRLHFIGNEQDAKDTNEQLSRPIVREAYCYENRRKPRLSYA